MASAVGSKEAAQSTGRSLADRKAGTTCLRCGDPRWPILVWTEPYTCQRCQEVLAGGNARDPRPSPAELERREAARDRLKANPIHGTGPALPFGGRK